MELVGVKCKNLHVSIETSDRVESVLCLLVAKVGVIFKHLVNIINVLEELHLRLCLSFEVIHCLAALNLINAILFDFFKVHELIGVCISHFYAI